MLRCAPGKGRFGGGETPTRIRHPGFGAEIQGGKRVLEALRRGKHLHVTLAVRFQPRSGGAPVTHLASVLAKVKKATHKKR